MTNTKIVNINDNIGDCWSFLEYKYRHLWSKKKKNISRTLNNHTNPQAPFKMARNLRHTLWLSWHAAHTPILLLDTVVSYNETSPIQQAPIQDQLATVQVQVEVLAIGPAQEQDVEYVNVVEDQDMQVENADGIYDLEEEET